MRITDRIRGRLVEIEFEKVEGFGWVAVGVVKEGLTHERGLLFEVKASDLLEAEATLRSEIEAFFA